MHSERDRERDREREYPGDQFLMADLVGYFQPSFVARTKRQELGLDPKDRPYSGKRPPGWRLGRARFGMGRYAEMCGVVVGPGTWAILDSVGL